MGEGNVNLDVIDTIQKHPLGAKYEDPLSGATFRYVSYDPDETTVDGTAGGAVVFADNVQWEVTEDVSDASVSQPAGFLQAVLTAGDFGWIQRSGYNRKSIETLGQVSDGDKVIMDSANNGEVDTMAAGEEHNVVGFAVFTAATITTLAIGDLMIVIE